MTFIVSCIKLVQSFTLLFSCGAFYSKVDGLSYVFCVENGLELAYNVL